MRYSHVMTQALSAMLEAAAGPKPTSDLPPNTVPSPTLGTVEELGDEPTSYSEVEKSSHAELWKEAMARELHGLTSNGTFSPVTNPLAPMS